MNPKDLHRSYKQRLHRSKAILTKVDPKKKGSIKEGRTERPRERRVSPDEIMSPLNKMSPEARLLSD